MKRCDEPSVQIHDHGEDSSDLSEDSEEPPPLLNIQDNSSSSESDNVQESDSENSSTPCHIFATQVLRFGTYPSPSPQVPPPLVVHHIRQVSDSSSDSSSDDRKKEAIVREPLDI